MDLQPALEKIAKESLDDKSLFLVALIIKGTSKGSKTSIIVDGDKGVSIDTCARISRTVASEIEALDLIDHAFRLEVSSPGLDHPLALHRQYVKNIGRQVKVTLKDEKVLEGALVSVDNQQIIIEKPQPKKAKNKEPEKLRLPFEEIVKTNVLVSFK
ncbi:MAG: ribosome maturation factor [Saprospiraceae bacterium]|nr:ribosome maturation factor [Saprospiraceae bacterium]